MKLAIMSDSHDRWDNLEKAIKIANDAQCAVLLFAGDLIAPPGIPTLEQFSGDIKVVWGNNEGEKLILTRFLDASPKIELCGDIFEGELGGLKVFMNHYPRITELVAKSGEFDLCIHGHTHIYREEKFGNTQLLNPGEIQGYKTGKPSFIIFDTESKSYQKIEL